MLWEKNPKGIMYGNFFFFFFYFYWDYNDYYSAEWI